MIERYRRVYSSDKDQWHRLELPHGVLEGDTLDETNSLYSQFGQWFQKECYGSWAYPSPGILLFSHEEDKVKVVLKYL